MEPFKDIFNDAMIETLGGIYGRVYPAFDQQAFRALARDTLASLELKERVLQIAKALDQTLPKDFDAAAEIVLASLHPSEDTDRDGVEFGPEGACGFAAWPLTEFIAMRGADHASPARALAVLKEVTKRFSAEFAVRPFLDKHTDEALTIFMKWAQDDNRHVRRLASEGCRPRLPWGMQLRKFVQDPALVLPILETLKDDPEDYVRRSVANNLNDIAKDHPDLVAKVAQRWLKGAGRNRQRLVKHACRTLIKQGHEGMLAEFGYKPIGVASACLTIAQPKVVYGDQLVFDLALSGIPDGINLMVDYAIHFVKANGKRAPKVFKWKDLQGFSENGLAAKRAHAIKPITTRTYYPGTHVLEVIVNGRSLAKAEFELIMP